MPAACGRSPAEPASPAPAFQSIARQREGPFEWQILLEGKDYYVDPRHLARAGRTGSTRAITSR